MAQLTVYFVRNDAGYMLQMSTGCPQLFTCPIKAEEYKKQFVNIPDLEVVKSFVNVENREIQYLALSIS